MLGEHAERKPFEYALDVTELFVQAVSLNRREWTAPAWGETSLRIGAVTYLNSKPLVEDLDQLLPHAQIELDYPSRLAEGLAQGRLDVALIPSVEYFRDIDYEIVSDSCVAAHGPVLSVKLYSRVAPGQVRKLAVDEGSRTSVALTRILLAERYGVLPQIEPFPLTRSFAETDADAILVIGDRAMAAPSEQFAAVWDLAEEWNQWTGLPFVFAMWVVRADTPLGGAERALTAARDLGVARLAAIAEREAPHLNLPVPMAFQYLSKNLHYQLGPAEQAGLKLFYQLASAQKLVPAGFRIVFRQTREEPRCAQPQLVRPLSVGSVSALTGCPK